MTIPQLFILGYALAFVLGGIIAWVYRGIEINDHREAVRVYRNLADRSIVLVGKYMQKLNRTTDRPRDKKTGQFQ